jgi:flagella basal body P-ring formation protein FlgA
MGGLSWAAAPGVGEVRSGTGSVAQSGHGSGHRALESGRATDGALTPELMRKAIHAHLEGIWGQRVKEVQVAVAEPSDPVGLPPGKVEWHVVPASSEEGMGRRCFDVVVTVNGRAWKTIEVLADVTATVDAVVLNRFVKPDEVIDGPDLKSARVRVSQLDHPFLTDRSEVIGKSAVRPLPADTPLRAAFLKAPLVIKKGDRVTIEARRGGLSIQTYGVTKSSGYVGQIIMVANQESGRELRAKVVGPGLVQVEF